MTNRTTMVETTTPSSISPSLPPLYFQRVDYNAFEALPCEMLTVVTSYLDWGDYARLATVHPSFQSILHDAAHYGGLTSKWTLARLLLDGSRGLAQNPALAIKYLKDLAAVDVDEGESCMEPDNADVTVTRRAQTDEEMYVTSAMRELATCNFSGLGVAAVDATEGLSWLKAAFHRGDKDASYEIATIYEYGNYGIPVEIYLAAEWFLTAANAGHVEAMAEYGMCCELGCGVVQSDEEALDWYTKAAHEGHVTSNYSVGEMFEEARGGLPQNDSEAVLWYYKAALMGCEDSKLAMTRLNDIARIVVPGWARTLHV
mmetsp:Transcript_36040/g.43045  ORF Transcript_36040/g.43045 Transcript_36040/m.43045 type:complete len:315 (+) Transcript_36040:81-1025(+)